MKKVRLWTVQKEANGAMKAMDVPNVDNAKTEEMLETLIVQSPQLLKDGLTIVGRQLPTEGGPLDLLGVDEDGTLIIYELKRGCLTRDAVAQVLDYESDITEMDLEDLAKLIEHASGQKGITTIPDFLEWYEQNYPSRESPLETPPKMVLVGLGVDKRALRMVNFLANNGIEISLLTFNAFDRDGALFLARQVESVDPNRPPTTKPASSQSKESNLQALHANATKMGVQDFIIEVADFIEAHFPFAKWPYKTTYAFNLQEQTENGKPTLRVYANLSLNWAKKGALTLILQERSVRILDADMLARVSNLKEKPSLNKWGQLEIPITKENWPTLKQTIEPVLTKLVDGWRKKTAAKDAASTDAATQSQP